MALISALLLLFFEFLFNLDTCSGSEKTCISEFSFDSLNIPLVIESETTPTFNNSLRCHTFTIDDVMRQLELTVQPSYYDTSRIVSREYLVKMIVYNYTGAKLRAFGLKDSSVIAVWEARLPFNGDVLNSLMQADDYDTDGQEGDDYEYNDPQGGYEDEHKCDEDPDECQRGYATEPACFDLEHSKFGTETEENCDTEPEIYAEREDEVFPNSSKTIAQTEPSQLQQQPPQQRQFNQQPRRLYRNRRILTFLGHKFCFQIISLIFQNFRNLLTSTKSAPRICVQSVGSDLMEFLEFVLENALIIEPDGTDLSCYYSFSEVIGLQVMFTFERMDMLSLFLHRFHDILASSPNSKLFFTNCIDRCGGKLKMFRKLFLIFVRLFPELFISHDNKTSSCIIEYTREFDGLANMGVVLRAFLLIDPVDVTMKNLKMYFDSFVVDGVVFPLKPCSVYFKKYLTNLSILIADSNFCDSTKPRNTNESKTEESQKKHILRFILRRMFGLKSDSEIVLFTVTSFNDQTHLFTALIHYFPCDKMYWGILLDLIISRHYLQSLLITLAYIDLVALENSLFAYETELIDTFDEKRQLFVKIMRQIYVIIVSCPGIPVGHSGVPVSDNHISEENSKIMEPLIIEWPCPSSLARSDSNAVACAGLEYESHPLFLEFGRIVLFRFFNIPLIFTRFANESHEEVTWSEMIGFMNFMIEKYNRKYSTENNEKETRNIINVIFRDTTAYSHYL